MKPFTQAHLDETVQRVAKRDKDLQKELKEKLKPSDELIETQKKRLGLETAALVDDNKKLTREGARLLETIVRPEAHPVLLIQNNALSFEMLSTRTPDTGTTWLARLREREGAINTAIPAVGRVEVDNHPDYTWVGTGWLIDSALIVTNRHVARAFARRGADGFTFRAGLDGVSMGCTLDFLEEYERSSEITFKVDSVAWISDHADVDVAFLRLREDARTLPTPIALSEAPEPDAFVATIGYPARDNRIADQRLVRLQFGDVYEKKRLAPGQLMSVDGDEVAHDCSTLGGNSGSVVLDLRSGQAVGLHFAGQWMTANYAVSSTKLQSLLLDYRSGKLAARPVWSTPPVTPIASPPADAPVAPVSPTPQPTTPNTIRIMVPLDITVGIGGTSPVVTPAAPVTTPPVSSGPNAADSNPLSPENLAKALAEAKRQLAGRDDVIDIRLGYRFKSGWIQNERVIVVVVAEKKSIPDLARAGTAIIPNNFLGIGVDVRTPELRDLLERFGIDLESLAPVGLEAKPGLYGEPPDLSLDVVKEKMTGWFHISPDAGWPTLKGFLSRVKKKLYATMYEWDKKNHISKAIDDVINTGDSFKCVTQYAGTHEAIDDMRERLGTKLKHRWASVGKDKLIPTAYHIKVASRDDEELWLSSGNWKSSNQPEIDPIADHTTAIGPLRDYNRDWHVVLQNKKLATLYRKYIEWDYEEAKRVPWEEALEPRQPELVTTTPVEEYPTARYIEPLFVDDEELEIQPLLTPDRDDHDRRIYMHTATELVKSATEHCWVQNQSFNLLAEDDNEDAFVAFFAALRDKHDDGVDVKIIFRDPREFSYASGSATLATMLERLKDFGFDTQEDIKVQRRLHTKAIMVDSREVLFGSHNLTNTGALYNRDASLLVRNARVTKYFEDIFTWDWKNLAKQSVPESLQRGELAVLGQETPTGARRIPLFEILEAL